MRKLIVAFLILVVASSCVTQKRCMKKFPPPPMPPPTTEVQEIITTETVYRDTTITVTMYADTIRDTAVIREQVGLINMARRELHTVYAYAFVEIVNGQLIFELQQKEAQIEQTIHNAIKEYTESHSTHEVIKEPYAVPYPMSWWESLYVTLGKVFMWVLIGAILFVIVRTVLALKFKI